VVTSRLQGLLVIFLLAIVPNIASSANLAQLVPGPGALDAHTGKGKWLVVMLWASDCVACNREAHQYVDFHEFHHDDNAQVLGISLDGSDLAAANAFIDKHQVSFPNLIAEFDVAGQWFENLTGQDFWGTPGFLIFDPEGNLRAQQIGAVPANLIEQFIQANSTTPQPAAN
jgi:peroxiredoxin